MKPTPQLCKYCHEELRTPQEKERTFCHTCRVIILAMNASRKTK